MSHPQNKKSHPPTDGRRVFLTWMIAAIHSSLEPTSGMCLKHREATRIIDEEITKYEESIRQLRSQRNDLAPISQLPPEIFGRIFVFVVPAARNVSYTRPASWFAFSHVSHLWRAIALETPGIWATPPLQYSQWTAVMLERCKMADLTIRIDFSRRPNTELLKNILENHLSHIREIDISDIQASNAAILFNSLPTYAPRLHRLRIYSTPLLGDRHIELPDRLVAEAEQLRDLDLSGCNLNWESPLFRGLAHLKIDNISTRPTTTDFLDALRQMPELETLDLQYSLPLSIQPPSNASGQSVELPHLRSLRLSSPMGEISQAIGFLTIPQTTAVEIESKGIANNSQLDGLVSWISTFSKGADTPYFTLSVTSDGDELYVKAWKKVVKGPYVNIYPLGVPDLSLKLKSQAGKMQIALLRIFISLQPRSITALYLCCPDISDDVLAKSFGSIPLLERVNVGGDGGAHRFIKALVYTSKGYQTSQSPSKCRIAFSALRYLSIEQAKFGGGYPDSTRIESLHEILIQRYEGNAALDKLGIFECYYFDDSALKLMEEIVVDVDWDGIEQHYEDDEEGEEEEEEDHYDENYDSEEDDYGYRVPRYRRW